MFIEEQEKGPTASHEYETTCELTVPANLYQAFRARAQRLRGGHLIKVKAKRDGSASGTWAYRAHNGSRFQIWRYADNWFPGQVTDDPTETDKIYLEAPGRKHRTCPCDRGVRRCQVTMVARRPGPGR